ncbi:Interleukin-1 receptor-associated kinase 4 [Trichoplax sp. H2]|nr:Interleukin-1 receptor-associated kinase 4 [Trichoplax sp. H2]|eukprot:RDD38107.1 Interleukin-1 receptor-associated kinase 4 [Trichoplax sp. H2]
MEENYFISNQDEDNTCCCSCWRLLCSNFKPSVVYIDPATSNFSVNSYIDDDSGNIMNPVPISVIRQFMRENQGWSGPFSTTYEIVSDRKLYAFKKWNSEVVRNYLDENINIINDLLRANVLIDERGVAKLSDGCIYRNIIRQSQLTLPCQIDKMGYCCEEALAGTVTFSNDIFSFGAICLVVVSGKSIYTRDRRPSMLKEYLLNTPYKNWKYLKDKRISWKKQISVLYTYRPRKKLLNLASDCLNETAQDRPSIQKVYECCQQLLNKMDK